MHPDCTPNYPKGHLHSRGGGLTLSKAAISLKNWWVRPRLFREAIGSPTQMQHITPNTAERTAD